MTLFTLPPETKGYKKNNIIIIYYFIKYIECISLNEHLFLFFSTVNSDCLPDWLSFVIV